MARPRSDLSPPAVLRLAGHPLRWRLLTELAHSDRRVRELTAAVDRPQSLVSYHLGRLRSARMLSMRRSAADGRDTYYSVDLARCGELLGGAGGALHPALHLVPPVIAATRAAGGTTRVLFLCTGNSARSQIAEALIEHLSRGSVLAASAGSRPKPLHPNAVRVMRERGIDISRRRTKHLSELLADEFAYVITLCDRVREVCPEFPGQPEAIHWSMADPAAEGTSNAETYPAFERTAAELEGRIGFLLHLIQSQRLTQEVI